MRIKRVNKQKNGTVKLTVPKKLLALSLILCKHQKVQKTKMYFREVVYRPLDCILAEDGAFVKGGAAVHLDP